jgi:hypothetical protein
MGTELDVAIREMVSGWHKVITSIGTPIAAFRFAGECDDFVEKWAPYYDGGLFIVRPDGTLQDGLKLPSGPSGEMDFEPEPRLEEGEA